MTVPSVAEPMIDVIGRLVEPAVGAVAAMAGASLTPTPPVLVEMIDPAVAASSVMARVPLTGPDASGSVVVLVPATGHKLDPMQVATAMVGSIANELTEITGRQYRSGAAEQVTGPVPAGPGDTIARFEVGTGSGPQLPIHWMVEATLGLALAGGGPVTSSPAAQPSVAPAAFPELAGNVGPGASRDLTLLSDVPMDVTVELGRAVLQVRQLLGLREGSIVELDRDAGAAVDVLVNGTLIARGDVVVIDDDLGVRITEIVQR